MAAKVEEEECYTSIHWNEEPSLETDTVRHAVHVCP